LHQRFDEGVRSLKVQFLPFQRDDFYPICWHLNAGLNLIGGYAKTPEYKEWLGGRFDASAFDLAAINEQLAKANRWK
jgi:hypothetical protein